MEHTEPDIDITTPAKPVTDDITRLRDLTFDQLCDILEANTASLNAMVERYNALLTVKTQLMNETQKLRSDNNRLSSIILDHGQVNQDSALRTILQALSDYNLQIHIEPRKVWDDAEME